MRELIISEISLMLRQKGFEVSSFTHTNTCFDLVAGGGGEKFVIKVYGNADAIRPEQANELSRIASAFDAVALIIGNKTKSYVLHDDTIYSRYGIPLLTPAAFRNALEERMPEKRFFKGKVTVSLNCRGLREGRKQLGMDMEALAEKAGTTPVSIRRYEKGQQASLDIARMLEKTLKRNLVESRNLFRKDLGCEEIFDSSFEDSVLERLNDLGLKIAEFRKAPFRGYSKPDESLVIQRVHHRGEMEKAVEDTRKAGHAFYSESVIVAKDCGAKQDSDVPVIKEEEIESFSGPADLMKAVRGKRNGST
jgi:predicted transcriptional regulator